MSNKKVLDACCGSRMMWFNKQNPDVLFADVRSEEHQLKDRGDIRQLIIKPDVIANFTDMPWPDNTFYHVVFDPPHLNNTGPQSWMGKKYGKLPKDWQTFLKRGFNECMRVLKPNGTLIFKWNETQILLSDVLAAIDAKPLYGHTSGRQSKTIWMAFLKHDNNEPNRA